MHLMATSAMNYGEDARVHLIDVAYTISIP